MQDTSHQLFTESVTDEVLLSMDNEDVSGYLVREISFVENTTSVHTEYLFYDPFFKYYIQ